MSKKKKTFGFGIIGCGMIADFHAPAIRAAKGATLVAVFSRSQANVDRVGQKHHCARYTDFKKFLAHPGLDIVTLATPSGAHMEPAIAAARVGKHVICEKPLEVTLERCDRMIEACRKHRVLLAGIYPYRTNGAVQALKKAVGQGRFGRITLADAYVKWYRSQKYYDGGGWRATWKLDGGGALMNQSIHSIDLLQWMAGPVESVSAFADCLAHQGMQTEDTAVAVLRFRSGALGVIEGATSASPGHGAQIQISGSAGSAFLKADKLTFWQFTKPRRHDRGLMTRYGEKLQAGPGSAADPRAISFKNHQYQFEDFIRALRTGKKLMVDGREARKAVEIILAIYKSAQTGRIVRLPLKRSPRLVNARRAAARARSAV